MPALLAAANPLSHVVDYPWLTGGDGSLWFLSNVTIMLTLASIATCLVVIPAAKKIATGTSGSLDDHRTQGIVANFVEAISMGLRDTIFKPLLGEDTDRYMPFLWTLFWFILFCNLLGLVPILDFTALIGRLIFGVENFHGIGGTATQSIWVTGGLAIVAAVYWNLQGLTKDPKGWFVHLTGGAPWYMWPILVPIEVLGLVIKPVALALRLFANMTGGHVLLAALFGFVGALFGALGTVGIGVGIIPLLGGIAIYMLEILVAFLQAFIFAFLSGLFLSQLVSHHHDHEDHHSHDGVSTHLHGEAPATGPVPGVAV